MVGYLAEDLLTRGVTGGEGIWTEGIKRVFLGELDAVEALVFGRILSNRRTQTRYG